MFRSRPKNFAFYRLEDGDRKVFLIERAPIDRDLATPNAKPMLAAFCGRLLAWGLCSCH